MAIDWKKQVEDMLAHLPPGVREEVTAQVIEDTEAGRPFGTPPEPEPETDEEVDED